MEGAQKMNIWVRSAVIASISSLFSYFVMGLGRENTLESGAVYLAVAWGLTFAFVAAGEFVERSCRRFQQ